MTASVTVDTSDVTRGLAKLSRNVATDTGTAARQAAGAVASSLRSNTPKRTGRLAATISVVRAGDGWGVSFGGGLPYARPVAARTRNVARAIAGKPDTFYRAVRTMTETQIGRL